MRAETGSATPAGTLLGRIERWARERPDLPAVRSGGRVLGYGELVAAAGRLAARLRRSGVGRDTLVPLWMEASPELVVAALGVLSAGGAYVGMDVDDPADRAKVILADCAAPVVLTSRALAGEVPASGAEVLIVEDLAAGGGAPPADPDVRPGDLCYVTFTSGSTGVPKGVLVEHGGVAGLVSWYVREFGIAPGDRMPQLARPSFDGWALEVWPCLGGGATLCLAGRRLPGSPQDLVDWLVRERVTVGFFTTALAVQLLDAHWPGPGGAFRAMLLGGEKLPAPPRVHPPFALHHVYGPTETTMLATCGEIPADAPRDASPPIGRPLPGLTGHVLDERRRSVPDGAPGELHIEGAAVARGYLNRPALTAERFRAGAAPGSRVYATGDLVRRRPDGALEFLGRTDAQIKLRGFRIEPGEIETAMLAVPGVAGAAAVVHEPPGRRDPDARRLVGYWTAARGAVPPDAGEITERLAERLPHYMVPAAIVRLDSLPLTPHGKTDRAALAAREPARPAERETGRDLAYRSDTERVLAEVWAKVLGVPEVGRDDGFFDLGGDSLLAMRAAAEARRRGVRLVAEDLFETDVLGELAAALDGRSGEPAGEPGTVRPGV
ncbi:non-ribosomal peptide synthetase [Actinomadura sp. NAK00032]|uniref:non-ribosomal peptide synthetase n=1 Tax=Actinomadura sp. NAK00032 TaxID=2742128 RepID=UPI00158FB660|nr:non-ribosomal peptide synthetase [Actinomadura sp. NAK00032]QKW35608.1 non-ribosomal peptide synthetase [Actinomadura sp. NAK00032]